MVPVSQNDVVSQNVLQRGGESRSSVTQTWYVRFVLASVVPNSPNKHCNPLTTVPNTHTPSTSSRWALWVFVSQAGHGNKVDAYCAIHVSFTDGVCHQARERHWHCPQTLHCICYLRQRRILRQWTQCAYGCWKPQLEASVLRLGHWNCFCGVRVWRMGVLVCGVKGLWGPWGLGVLGRDAVCV